MSEKKVRNKFKEFIWDYYLTNKEISKQNDKEKFDEGWNKNAKIYLVIIVLGFIGIIFKYFLW